MFILEHGLCQSAVELINCRICKGNILGLETKKAHIFCPRATIAQSTDLECQKLEGGAVGSSYYKINI